MLRLLFTKTGKSIWISHLDLMRLFQRAFKRAGLPLTHTQGFNPRPSVSIALPMSVGVESQCELLDFALSEDVVSCREIKDRLNETLIEGIRVLDVYETGKKLRELALLESTVTLIYEKAVPDGAVEAVRELFSRQTLIVPKKTKNGIQDQDLVAMIRRIECRANDEKTLELRVLGCCQNPTLNPMQLVAAVKQYLPEYAPDLSGCRRIEIFDNQERIFR